MIHKSMTIEYDCESDEETRVMKNLYSRAPVIYGLMKALYHANWLSIGEKLPVLWDVNRMIKQIEGVDVL